MIYCISDIHGCYDQFQRLLDLVSPGASDEVYVLGDVVDRGPKSAAMLRWCVDEAPKGFHFLLGNHEDMAGCVIERDPKRVHVRDGWFRGADPWSYNGGRATACQLRDETDVDWRATKLAPWLRSLSPFVPVDVGERRVMLVHAGFDPSRWVEGARFWCDGLDDPLSHHATVEVGEGFGEQEEQHMVWAREGWYDRPEDAPLETVFGHTPTTNLARLLMRWDGRGDDADEGETGGDDAWWRSLPDGTGRIWHYRNRHDIDCGCAYGGRLAALRLDDMEEFYVDGLER